MILTSKQRKYLRSQAHHLKPVVLIGKLALNDSVLKSINQSLEHHELIKIKFNDHKSSKEILIKDINNHNERNIVTKNYTIKEFYEKK